MCWSFGASATLAVSGVAATGYFYRKGEDKALYLSLFYFTLMEVIQTYTYTVIDQCFNPNNTFITRLAYLHVAFQPFFFNALAMYFIPHQVRKKIQPLVYFICTLAAMALIVRILPLAWQQYCYQIKYYVPFMKNVIYQVPFCGETTCSTTGSWHLEWAISAGFNWYLDRVYFVTVFILPLLYGSWKSTLYATLMGPVITLLLTATANEFAAVWCLFSMAILLLMLNSPVRKLLYVNSFYGFKCAGFR
jgi:hypothetical protein